MDPLETKTPRPTFTQQGARCPRSHFAQEESQVATCRVKHIVNPGRKKIEFFFFFQWIKLEAFILQITLAGENVSRATLARSSAGSRSLHYVAFVDDYTQEQASDAQWAARTCLECRLHGIVPKCATLKNLR